MSFSLVRTGSCGRTGHSPHPERWESQSSEDRRVSALFWWQIWPQWTPGCVSYIYRSWGWSHVSAQKAVCVLFGELFQSPAYTAFVKPECF